MRVENYSEKHFLTLMRLVESFHKEAVGEYVGQFDAQTVIEAIQECDNSNCFMLIDDSDDCVGVLYGVITKAPISGRLIFQEVMWYVDPDKRRDGAKFLGEVENILQNRGIDIIIMVSLKNSMFDRLKKFYERRGYKEVETHYMREL